MSRWCILALMLTLGNSSQIEKCPWCRTCRPTGNCAALCRNVGGSTEEEEHRFRALVEGFYPGLYSDTEGGKSIRDSCILRCFRGRPSKTDLGRVFSNMDMFGEIDHCEYQVPGALVVDCQSRHYLKSVRTMLYLSHKYPSYASWFGKAWDPARSFSKSDFYQWAKDIPIFENSVIRGWYLKREGMQFAQTINRKVVPGAITTEMLALSAPTIGSEFPEELLDVLFACRHQSFRDLAFKGRQVAKLLHYGLIAIDTMTRQSSKAVNGLTNKMLTQFITFLSALEPNIKYQASHRRPALQYTSTHPAAVAFQTALSSRLDALLEPRIDWDTFVVTADHIDLIMTRLISQRRHMLRDVMIAVFCAFANTHNEQCVHVDLDATLMIKTIPHILQALSDKDAIVPFVAILHKLDLAGMSFQAAKEGYTPSIYYEYSVEMPEAVWLATVMQFKSAEAEWIGTAFDIFIPTVSYKYHKY